VRRASAARSWQLDLRRRTLLPISLQPLRQLPLCCPEGTRSLTTRTIQQTPEACSRLMRRGRFDMCGEDQARAGTESSTWRHEEANRPGSGTLVLFSVSAHCTMLHEASLQSKERQARHYSGRPPGSWRSSSRRLGPAGCSEVDGEIWNLLLEQEGCRLLWLTVSIETGSESSHGERTWGRSAF
jgi:hypothetical protein